MSDTETPALDAWQESHPYRTTARDVAKTDLWFPQEAPWVRLDTIDRGCQKPPVLPDPERPACRVYMGSLSVGGYLSEMEAYFAAVLDALRLARREADGMAADRTAEEP